MIARIVVFGLLASMATQAFAAGVVVGKVVDIRVDKSGVGMVIFDQTIGGTPPSCVHAAYVRGLSFDANSPGGKIIFAMALAAKASGDPVEAHGTGTCVNYGNAWVEDWFYGHVR